MTRVGPWLFVQNCDIVQICMLFSRRKTPLYSYQHRVGCLDGGTTEGDSTGAPIAWSRYQPYRPPAFQGNLFLAPANSQLTYTRRMSPWTPQKTCHRVPSRGFVASQRIVTFRKRRSMHHSFPTALVYLTTSSISSFPMGRVCSTLSFNPLLLISCQFWSWSKAWATQMTLIREKWRKVRIVLTSLMCSLCSFLCS